MTEQYPVYKNRWDEVKAHQEARKKQLSKLNDQKGEIIKLKKEAKELKEKRIIMERKKAEAKADAKRIIDQKVAQKESGETKERRQVAVEAINESSLQHQRWYNEKPSETSSYALIKQWEDKEPPLITLHNYTYNYSLKE